MVVARFVWFVLSHFVACAAMAQLPPVPDAGSAETKKPQLFVAERVADLGKVLEGDKATASWKLENRGHADLIITGTKSSCGCAVVKLTEAERVIPPGKVLMFKVVFDSSRRRGPQKKTVLVETNDPTEPRLTLEFKATVDFLYEVNPSTIVNLQMLRRGETAARTLDITPGPGRPAVEILEVKIDEAFPLVCVHEPFQAKGGGQGQRFRFSVKKDAALGKVKSVATVRLKVGEIEKEREVPIRAQVVGDLSVHPMVVDTTRQVSTRGKQLAPVTVRSNNRTPFDVLSASAGPLLDVEVEPVKSGPARTNYRLLVTIRNDAQTGPFGASLDVETTSPDQPMVSVPIFGIVAPRIDVDPPVILLRQDGTPVGTQRRLRLKASVREVLEISNVACGIEVVEATVDNEASAMYRHLRVFDVRLTGELPAGIHETTLVMTTSIEGAERLEIPVRIEVPG
jgi:hypothetical protein